jgi:hypothetical protein
MAKRIVFAAAAVSLALTGTAGAKQYILKHPKREYCKAQYVRKVEHVKRREHGRIVKVRRVACVYVAPRKKLTAVAPAHTVHLKAHLDPSFTRDPNNPLAVTYAYSASASAELLDAPLSVEPAPLPEGILQLFSDGSLACSLSVGGSTTGGQCPVTYPALGAHTVVTTYMSGSTSATETSIETIEPFSTTTTLNVSTPEECGERQETEPAPRPASTIHFCFYMLSASTVDQNGNPDDSGLHFSFSDLGLMGGVPYRAEVTEVIHPAWEGGSEWRACFIHGFSPYDAGPYCPTSAPATWIITASGGAHPGWTGSQSAAREVTSG